jgi:hypothetical protein
MYFLFKEPNRDFNQIIASCDLNDIAFFSIMWAKGFPENVDAPYV